VIRLRKNADAGQRAYSSRAGSGKRIPAVLASKVELISFKGGREEDYNPCEAMTYHGFLGLEDQVVTAIARWIKKDVNP